MENTRYLEGSTEHCSGNKSSKQEKITLRTTHNTRPPAPAKKRKKEEEEMRGKKDQYCLL